MTQLTYIYFEFKIILKDTEHFDNFNNTSLTTAFICDTDSIKGYLSEIVSKLLYQDKGCNY